MTLQKMTRVIYSKRGLLEERRIFEPRTLQQVPVQSGRCRGACTQSRS